MKVQNMILLAQCLILLGVLIWMIYG